MDDRLRVGAWATYTLTADDARRVDQQRAASGGALLGNPVNLGDRFPMMITRVWGTTRSPSGEWTAVNGQVFLDGNDALWVMSVYEDEVGDPFPPTPGRFRW